MPFFAGTLFCTVFARPKEQKKGHSRISDEKGQKIRIMSFLYGLFFYKREKYLLIFAYSMFFNKQNPTYLKFYTKSVSFN